MRCMKKPNPESRKRLNAIRDHQPGARLPRLHEISSILIRYGGGDLVRRLGWAACWNAPDACALEQAVEMSSWNPRALSPSLEELGRPSSAGPGAGDTGRFIPTALDRELEKLQSNAPALPLRHAAANGAWRCRAGDPREVFDELNTTPAPLLRLPSVRRQAEDARR